MTYYISWGVEAGRFEALLGCRVLSAITYSWHSMPTLDANNTQELWLAALPIAMPLLALYASREKEKLDLKVVGVYLL